MLKVYKTKGTVKKGMGQGSIRMRDEKTLKMLRDVTKMEIIPGTLNLLLDEKICLERGTIVWSPLYGKEAKSFELYQCLINNRKAYIARLPLSSRALNIIEIISDFRIRDELKLKDDDKVVIEVIDKI